MSERRFGSFPLYFMTPFFPWAQAHRECSPLCRRLATHRQKGLSTHRNVFREGEATQRRWRCTIEHVGNRVAPCDKRWHETKQPLLLLPAREDSTNELCCNHFCLWCDTYDGRRVVGGRRGGVAARGWGRGRRHTAYLHTVQSVATWHVE